MKAKNKKSMKNTKTIEHSHKYQELSSETIIYICCASIFVYNICQLLCPDLQFFPIIYVKSTNAERH